MSRHAAHYLLAARYLLIGLAWLWGPVAAIQAQGVRADDWDRIFQRREGWTGADGAGTVVLPDGRVLWMFGDTWIGRVVDGKHASGSKLVNITLGIHPFQSETRTAPRPESVEFVSGKPDAESQPTAWLRPDPTLTAGEKAWFWPMGGGAVTRSSDDPGSLLVFMWSVARTKEDRGIWSFRTVGHVVAVVDNWQAPIQEWKPRQVSIPHARLRTDDRPFAIDWGYAVLMEEGASPDRWLYVYGLGNRKSDDRELLVARAPVGQVLDFTSWRFYAGGDRWTDDVERAAGIAKGMVSEFSVERIVREGQPQYVLVQSEPYLGKHILIRTANQPTGPWSEPRSVFEVPELARNPAYITYAAKGHAALSPPGELLITYVVNSTDFPAMVADADIYRPRFIRVPLRELPAP